MKITKEDAAELMRFVIGADADEQGLFYLRDGGALLISAEVMVVGFGTIKKLKYESLTGEDLSELKSERAG